jgi:Plasmid pRiA4b ORF-3-like protein
LVRSITESRAGDGWEHEILLEKVLGPKAGSRYPICTEGKRVCPPEDVGGSTGYANFLEAISDPSHEEHDEYVEWIGGEFDPEEFDVDLVNQRLKRIR